MFKTIFLSYIVLGIAQGGINIALNQQLFNNIEAAILPILISKIANISILNKWYVVGTPELNMNFTLYFLKVSAFNIDTTNSQIIVNSNNTLTFEMMISTLKLDYQFKMDGLDHWIIGFGEGHLYLTNFGFKATLGLGLKNGNMNVTFNYIQLDFSNKTIDFYIDGTNDWIKLVNISAGYGLPYVINEIGGSMAPSVMNQLATVINGLLSASPSVISLLANVFINYGITSGIITTNQYVQFGLNGTIYTDNIIIPVIYPTKPVAIPPLVNGAGDMQIIISQNVILSAIYSIYSQNLMNIAVKEITSAMPVNTQFIAVFIPEVMGMYPPSTNGQILLNITAPPTFIIAPSLITLGTVADSEITLGNGTDKFVSEVTMNIQFQMAFSASNGYLKGTISGYTFSLIVAKSRSGVSPNQESLNQLFNTVLKIAIPQINDFVNVGLVLPSYLGLTFKNSTVLEGNQYLVIGASPKPSKSTTDMLFGGLATIDYDSLLKELEEKITHAVGRAYLFGF